MKFTKAQQDIITSIKLRGKVWVNPTLTPRIYKQHMKLVDKGILTYHIDGIMVMFDLV